MRYLALLALVGCASDGKAVPTTDAQGNDAPSGCQVTLSFTPTPAHSGETVRAVATVTNPGGLVTFSWTILFNNNPVTYTPAQPDGSQVDFLPTTPGTYLVSVTPSGGNNCFETSENLDVLAPGANTADYRLHVFPPASLAPPQDWVIEVDGGADVNRAIALDPGMQPTLALTDGTNGVSGYVRFISPTSPVANIETYTQSDGNVHARVLGQPYSVLVVPATAALAPALLAWQPGTQLLVVPPGALVAGSVKDASGAALAGATVQLTAGGVPSTIATTASNGSFSVRATLPSGAPITVDVTPPAGRGLPRLAATGAFDLTKPVNVAYAAGLATTCNLAGTPVQRGSMNQPGAQVNVVGNLATAGSVVAGATVTATGVVRVAATADGTGKLPTTIVPRAMLSAVVQLASGDRAVAALDTSACAATTIAAPVGPTAAGTVVDAMAHPLAGVRVEASTTRALALAGVPAVQVVTDGSGHFALPLAAGGYYDVRFVDPLQRAAQLVLADTPPSSIPTTAVLAKALRMSGLVSVVGNPNPVDGAAIQILCATCSGLAASVPISETATDSTSSYQLAVPDPGTM